MKDLELGYVAGLYDGEGSTSVRTNRVQVRIGSTDKDILEKVLVFTDVGSINGPFKLESGKLNWVWNLTDKEQVVEFLSSIYPLVSMRRQERITEALEFLIDRINKSKKECWYCDKPFVSFDSRVMCCSKPCSDKHQYFKRTGTRIEERILTCPSCKEMFTSTQPTAVCCSRLCDQRNRRKNDRKH